MRAASAGSGRTSASGRRPDRRVMLAGSAIRSSPVPNANRPAVGPGSTPRALARPTATNARTSRSPPIRRACIRASTSADAGPTVSVSARASTTAAAAAAAATIAVAARRALLTLARRRVLRPLDQLLGLDEVAVLVLGDELQADAAPILVDLLDDHVERVAAGDHVLDVSYAPGADVGDVEQAVGALLQLDEGAELGRLDDAAGVGVSHLRLLRDPLDRRDRGRGLLAVGRVDEDRAVLLDVDLHLVVGLER